MKHIFIKMPKSRERVFQGQQRALLTLPSPALQTSISNAGMSLVRLHKPLFHRPFNTPKSHLHSKVLLNKSKPEILLEAFTPSRAWQIFEQEGHGLTSASSAAWELASESRGQGHCSKCFGTGAGLSHPVTGDMQNSSQHGLKASEDVARRNVLFI